MPLRLFLQLSYNICFFKIEAIETLPGLEGFRCALGEDGYLRLRMGVR